MSRLIRLHDHSAMLIDLGKSSMVQQVAWPGLSAAPISRHRVHTSLVAVFRLVTRARMLKWDIDKAENLRTYEATFLHSYSR